MNNYRPDSDNVTWASQDEENKSSDPIESWWECAAVDPKDLLDRAENWSLAADAATATILKSLSQKIILHTQEVVSALSSVHENSEKLNAAVQNTNTEFHLLSNIQFIENRTYQDNDNLADDDDKPQTKSEHTPEELFSSYKRALQTGVELVGNTIQRYEISDSDSDSESPARPLTVFKRIDSYGNRKLPLIIGSEEFYKDETLRHLDPSTSESEVDDEKMKSHTGYKIKGISSKILEDESDSDIDVSSNAEAITSKLSQDSSFTPAAAVPGIAAHGKNGLSPPFRGVLSDLEDDGPLIFAPDAIRSNKNISTPKEAKSDALFNKVFPNPPSEDEKQRKDNKSFDIKNELRRNIITADDSNEEDSLFYSKSNCTMVPGSKVLLPQNSSKRAKPSRKLRKKKGLFDSSSSSSDEEAGSSNITTSENGIIPGHLASCSKKPVGGISIFNAAITEAIHSQKHDDSSAIEQTNISSSGNSSSPSSSVKNRIVKKATDQAISSSVRSKSSHTTSVKEAKKVPKPVRHNSLFSDEEDLFASVPVQKSHTSSGNPVSLFDDSDDDLFGAPSKAKNVISTNPNFTPQVALLQSKNGSSEPKETKENDKFSVKSKVYETNKTTPPRIKNLSRKTAKSIFMSSSSGDEEIFTPPPLPKNESQRKSFLPSALDSQRQKSVQNYASEDEDDLFGPPPLPTLNVKPQLPEIPKFSNESKNSLKVKDSVRNPVPNQSKEKDFDALKTNVQQDNKNLKHHKTNANPFSSSSDDDIFNFSIPSQNKGQLTSTSKTDKENYIGVAAPNSYKSINSSAIDVKTKSQELSNGSHFANSIKPNDSYIIQSQPVSADSSKPYENSKKSTANLEKRKPVTIFDDDSDEDIFAIDFAIKTTHINSNEKHHADFQIPSDVISSNTLTERFNNDVVSSAVEKPCITGDKSGEATTYDAVSSLADPSQDTLVDVCAKKTQLQDGSSLVKQIKKISTDDFSIFDDEDSDDIFSTKSTGKVFTKKIDDGNKSFKGKPSLIVTASGVTKDRVSSYDEDDIFSSSLPCQSPINSLSDDVKSTLFNSSNQNTLACAQSTGKPTQGPAPEEQSKNSNEDKAIDPPTDLSSENKALPTVNSSKNILAAQIYHNASNDPKMITKVSISDDKLKKSPPKVSKKPAVPKTEKTFNEQVEPSAVDCSGGKSVKRTEQFSDLILNKPNILPVVTSNVDTKSPKKPPVGGVALFGGNELLAKIKKRQGSEDINEHECTSPNFKENISDNYKTIPNNLEKHSSIQSPIQPSGTMMPSFSKIDSKSSGEAHQKVITLEKGSSFDDLPASSTNVLKSMNKDRPRIKQQRNPPSRSRRKSVNTPKNIKDKNYIEDLSELDNDSNRDISKDFKPGVHNSTMCDIFGNDDDNDNLFSFDKSTKEDMKSKENIVTSKSVSNTNEIVTKVQQCSKTEENVIVPKHFCAKPTEKLASSSREIADKGSDLKYPDVIQPKLQQLDSKTKKTVLKPLNLFGDDEDEDDELFGGSLSTEKIKAIAVVTSKPKVIISKKKTSLFSDDEDEDPVFDTKGTMSQQKKDITTKTKKTSLFSDDESEDLFNSSSIDRKESKKESKPAFQPNKSDGETLKERKKDFCNDPLMCGQI